RSCHCSYGAHAYAALDECEADGVRGAADKRGKLRKRLALFVKLGECGDFILGETICAAAAPRHTKLDQAVAHGGGRNVEHSADEPKRGALHVEIDDFLVGRFNEVLTHQEDSALCARSRGAHADARM